MRRVIGVGSAPTLLVFTAAPGSRFYLCVPPNSGEGPLLTR
jgi:hypothetical protein